MNNAKCPKCGREYLCQCADKITDLNCADCLMDSSEIVKLLSLSPSEAAATLGRVKTKKKARSSRENGRKGGRPRKAL